MAVALALPLCACEVAPQGRCRLSSAHTIARSRSHAFDALAIVALPKKSLAFWSDTAGLWGRAVDEDGVPKGPEMRIGERCAGGLSAARFRDEAWLACVRTPAPRAVATSDPSLADVDASGSAGAQDNDVGTVTVLAIDGALRAAGERVVGAPGSVGRGVSLAIGRTGEGNADTAFIAFQEATRDAHRVQLSALTLADTSGPEGVALAKAPLVQQTLSRSAMPAQTPNVHLHDGHVYVAFVEWDLAFGEDRASLRVSRDGKPGTEVRKLHVFDGAPVLSHDDTGLLLTFRDRIEKSTRSEQMVARLAPDLTLQRGWKRIGRANGKGGPTLHGCAKLAMSATPIEHGSELYVVFHALDGTLTPVTPNHQCYASERRLVSVASSCGQRGLVALVGELTGPSDATAELLAMGFSCTDGAK